MLLIRSHRLSGRIAVFLAVAMLVTIVPGSGRPAAAAVAPPTTVLLFPAVAVSTGEVVDLPELTTNRLQAALDEVEELAVTEPEKIDARWYRGNLTRAIQRPTSSP